MNSIYHNLRKIKSDVAARLLIREVLAKNNGNVTKTASILGISRHTVRRARDGRLEDCSRAPKRVNRKYSDSFKQLILVEAKNTGYGARRLSKYLKEKYSILIQEDYIKFLLRKNKVNKKYVRTKNNNRRRLYDYESLLPFTELQVDTKHILDEKALPMEVYEHIKNRLLPTYAYNAIDVKTRIRFTMYAHSLNATYGILFLFIVILWMRLNNVRDRIRIRVDNGGEFFSGSEKKLKTFNDLVSILNAEAYTIPPRAKHLQGIIESSHKLDDEYFFSSHVLTCNDDRAFIKKAQEWLNVWNTARNHFGVGMNGDTPLQKLKSLKTIINQNIVKFPVLMLEDVTKYVGNIYDIVVSYISKQLINQGGKYVIDQCLFYFFCLKNEKIRFSITI